MTLIRYAFGMIYLLAILSLAIDSFYYLLAGIIPSEITYLFASLLSFVQKISHIAGYPVEYLMNILLGFLPKGFGAFLPITDTEILGAKIAWVPILSLLIYTSILKSFSDFVLKTKVTGIQKNYRQKDGDSQ